MGKVQNYNKKIFLNITKKMKIENIKIKDISQKIGISQSAVSQQLKRLSEGKGVMTDSIFKILVVLNMELEELTK